MLTLADRRAVGKRFSKRIIHYKTKSIASRVFTKGQKPGGEKKQLAIAA